MKIKCPLCGKEKLKKIEAINVSDIIYLWSKLKTNVIKLFDGVDSLDKLLCENCSLIFFYPFIAGDDSFYSKLGEEEWYYLHNDKTEFSYANQYIKKGDIVLDIGSGRGAFTKYIDKEIQYTGLELSSKAIEYANKENINVIKQTIENHAKNNPNKYDIVASFQVLEHLHNIDSFLQSAITTMKAKGLLIIAVPNNDTFLKEVQNNLLNLPPHHLLHWHDKSLKYIAKKYNLEVVDIYKEKVTNIHKEYYFSTKIFSFFRSIFMIKTKTINIIFISKIIQITSALFAKILKFSNIHKNKDGHTIAIVFKNNA